MNRRLLILDDEPVVLEGYKAILSIAQGAPPVIVSSRRQSTALAPRPVVEPFEAVYVTEGEDALVEIQRGCSKKKPFVGGFFDVKLKKGIDGIETIRRAKELDPNLLCVVVTAYQDRSIDEITKIFGEDFDDRWDFLSKPFLHAEILQKAKHLIYNWDRRRREREYLQQIWDQQEQLVRSARMAAVGTLARGIGHEFGNILLRIMGKAELALEKLDPKEMEGALRLISTSSERAGVIVRNLQSMVRMEVKRELVSPLEPLSEALQLMGHELRKSKVQVTEQYQAGIPKISLNKIEMGQVYLNLLINAIHALEPEGGELRLRAHQEKESVCIEITDTGCGIAPENIDKIFEPLFTTKGGKGSGIGLSVSKKIIENHGGRLHVQSKLGKGTVFTIRLPLKGG